DVIYVKNKSVRLQLAEALTRSRPELADRMQIFVRTGLISSELVTDPALLPLVTQLQSDLIRTAKQVDAIETALAVMRPATLLNSLRIVPRPGEPDGRWIGIAEAIPTRDAAGQLTEPVVPGLDDQLARTIAGAWQ